MDWTRLPSCTVLVEVHAVCGPVTQRITDLHTRGRVAQLDTPGAGDRQEPAVGAVPDAAPGEGKVCITRPVSASRTVIALGPPEARDSPLGLNAA